MKFAVNNTPFLNVAVIALLTQNGYTQSSAADAGNFILVNPEKRTYKYGNDNKGRDTYNPASHWATIASALVPMTATAVVAIVTEVPTNTQVTENGLRVGDQVRATNNRRTNAKFQLATDRVYTIARITAKGNVGLEGLPNDEYLAKRFTKVGTTTATAAATAAPAPAGTYGRTAVAPTPAVARAADRKTAVDAAGNTISVGDTVLVLQPTGKKRLFNLKTNGVAKVTRITAKGALGFAFDTDNEFLAKRFQKVTTSPAAGNVTSGSLVVASARRDGRFALPTDTALTFRGVTVEGGNFILDGYTADQYAPSRFTKLTKVGTVRR